MFFDFYREGYTAGEECAKFLVSWSIGDGRRGRSCWPAVNPTRTFLKRGSGRGGRRLKIKQAQVEFCSARMTRAGGGGGGGGERVETEMSRDKSRGSAALSKRG